VQPELHRFEITVKESKKNIMIEALDLETRDRYQIKQALSEKDAMLKIYEFSLYRMVEHLEISQGKLFLYFPESNPLSNQKKS
jgi:hypothetical protein